MTARGVRVYLKVSQSGAPWCHGRRYTSVPDAHTQVSHTWSSNNNSHWQWFLATRGKVISCSCEVFQLYLQ